MQRIHRRRQHHREAEVEAVEEVEGHEDAAVKDLIEPVRTIRTMMVEVEMVRTASVLASQHLHHKRRTNQLKVSRYLNREKEESQSDQKIQKSASFVRVQYPTLAYSNASIRPVTSVL